MNLNNSPKIEELRNMIKNCDDKAGHHVLWVKRNGDVIISQLEHETPARWAARMGREVLFRYESFAIGNSYVGEDAANDEDYLKNLYDWLIGEWEAHKELSHS